MSVEASLDLGLQPERAFLRHRRSEAITAMAGFIRGRHRPPRGSGLAAEQFVHEVGGETMAEEVRAIYDASKHLLGLRRRQLTQALAAGGGNVETPHFEFVIELGLDPEDAARALWQRRFVLLVGPSALPPGFDELFPIAANELVIPFETQLAAAEAGRSEQFDGLVDRLEDFAEDHGGGVDEDEARGCATLQTTDGSRITLDLDASELSLEILGIEGCRALLLEAEHRFAALAAPIVERLDRPSAGC